MKTVLAIVCSLVLAGMLFVPATAAGVAPAASACCCDDCTTQDCCLAAPSPESQPAPAAPVSLPSPNQFSTLAQVVVAWTLPTAPARERSASFSSPSLTSGAPLFARNCAWLI